MSRLLFSLLIGPALALPVSAAVGGPEALEVNVQRVEAGGQTQFEIDASGEVRASPAAVWKVLTAYERMPEFVPDLDSNRVLARKDNEVVIDQQGSARFLFMRKQIRLVVRATETPMTNIDIALVSGDMKLYEAHWEMTALPDTGGTRIQYRGKMVPDFYVPGMLGASLIRTDIRRMMEAVLQRLDQPAELSR